jgi:hypothetical protein
VGLSKGFCAGTKSESSSSKIVDGGFFEVFLQMQAEHDIRGMIYIIGVRMGGRRFEN